VDADAATLPVLRSALDAAGIPYIVDGEGVVGILPLGDVTEDEEHRGFGIVLHVPADRAEEARALLAGDATLTGDDDPETPVDPGDPTSAD